MEERQAFWLKRRAVLYWGKEGARNRHAYRDYGGWAYRGAARTLETGSRGKYHAIRDSPYCEHPQLNKKAPWDVASGRKELDDPGEGKAIHSGDREKKCLRNLRVGGGVVQIPLSDSWSVKTSMGGEGLVHLTGKKTRSDQLFKVQPGRT